MLGCVWLCWAVYGYVGYIKGHVGLCRAMCGYVCLCRAVYGYVGLCMALYVYVWLCRAMYGYVHVGHICLCITM